MVTCGTDIQVTSRSGFGNVTAAVREELKKFWPGCIEEEDAYDGAINLFFYKDEFSQLAWNADGCTPEYADMMIQVTGNGKICTLVVDHISHEVEVLLQRIRDRGFIAKVAHEGLAYSPLA